MVEGDIGYMLKKIKRAIAIIFTKSIYKIKRIGKNSAIYKPLQIDNPKGIIIGNGVTIYHSGWLMGTKKENAEGLVIDDNTVIGHFSHIIANQNVHIGKSVLIANKVFISDCTHQYKNIYSPVMNQEIREIKPVYIGDGSWLGENVCVCGANIGKQCVIGANSVVIEDVPDYSVAVGSPAKIVKQYNFDMQRWEPIE